MTALASEVGSPHGEDQFPPVDLTDFDSSSSMTEKYGDPDALFDSWTSNMTTTTLNNNNSSPSPSSSNSPRSSPPRTPPECTGSGGPSSSRAEDDPVTPESESDYDYFGQQSKLAVFRRTNFFNAPPTATGLSCTPSPLSPKKRSKSMLSVPPPASSSGNAHSVIKSALSIILQRRDPKMLEKLLDSNPLFHVDTPIDSFNYLQQSQQNGQTDSVTPIPSSRSCISSSGRKLHKETLLVVAVREDVGEIVEVLLQRGANPLPDCSSPHGYCWGPTRKSTALHFTAQEGCMLAAAAFLRFGELVDIDARDSAGNTALHIATSKGRVGIGRLLVDAGCNVNMRNAEDQTPLHIAAIRGDNKFFDLLCKGGADPFARTTRGQSFVELACLQLNMGFLDLVPLDLLRKVVSSEIAPSTPLHEAAKNNKRKIIEWLLENKICQIEAVDRSPFWGGCTPLQVACMEGHTKAALCLLSFGADPHKINPLHNCSALGYAWENGLVAVQLAITNEMHTKPKKRSRSSFYPNYTKRELARLYLWYEPGAILPNGSANPFPARLLDCTAHALSTLSSSDDSHIMNTWLRSRKNWAPIKGKNDLSLMASLPHKHEKSVIEMSYTLEEEMANNIRPLVLSKSTVALKRAETMEEKWDMLLVKGTICFLRSWTQIISYRLTVDFDERNPNILYVLLVESCPSAARYEVSLEEERLFSLQETDFLMKRLLLGQNVPHPFHPSWKELGIEELINLSWSYHGSDGFMGTFDNLCACKEVIPYYLLVPRNEVIAKRKAGVAHR